MVLPVTTWAAYNVWGGRSLYDGGGFNGLPRANAVSLDRPMNPIGSPIWEATQGHPFFTWEYPLVRWIEREGFDAGYVTSLELQRGELPRTAARRLRRPRRVLERGDARRRSTSRSPPGRACSWAGANGLCWNIRLEPSSSARIATMTCYKDHLSDPPSTPLQRRSRGDGASGHCSGRSRTPLASGWVDWDFALNRRPAAWIVATP